MEPSHQNDATRDKRIDFVRGVALLVIFTAHAHINPFCQWEPQNYGFSDMAEVFVFLSGYVCGLSYQRLLKREGIVRCQIKAFRRCSQLYFARLALLLVFYMLVAVLACYIPTVPRLLGLESVNGFELNLGSLFHWMLSPNSQPYVVDILPLYITVLFFLPIVMALLQSRAKLVLMMSTFLYLTVQLFPQSFRSLVVWSPFNPAAWQLLFYGAAAIAVKQKEIAFISVPRKILLAVAILIIEASFYLKIEYPYVLPAIGKANLEPLRLLHFLAILYVGTVLLKYLGWVCETRLAKPFVICGQNSLATYCFGAISATVVTLLLLLSTLGEEYPWVVMILGWLSCICGAYLVSTIKVFSRLMQKRASDLPDLELPQGQPSLL